MIISRLIQKLSSKSINFLRVADWQPSFYILLHFLQGDFFAF